LLDGGAHTVYSCFWLRESVQGNAQIYGQVSSVELLTS
jgi:hypothetical protein